MRVRVTALFLGIAVLLLAVAALGQKPTVKKTSAAPTSAASAQEMYQSYCAACHGQQGKGDGPAAPAMKVPPPDLTTLAHRNGGQFPSLRVSHTISGEENLAAHGSKEMPVWGPIFRSVSQHDRAIVQLRVTNLTKHIESLQVK